MKIMLNKLFQFGLIAVFLFGNAISMENDDEKLLVIGCRPWDKNIEGFSSIETADFVDFMVEYTQAPETLPSNFYHFDLNANRLDEKKDPLYSAGYFSDFAASNGQKYQTIIVDWATYQHIQRDSAGIDFANLLNEKGSLIVPVAFVKTCSTRGQDGYLKWETVIASQEAASQFIESKKLNELFNEVKILSYNDTLQDARFDLLRRPNLEPTRLEDMLNMVPSIIIATK